MNRDFFEISNYAMNGVPAVTFLFYFTRYFPHSMTPFKSCYSRYDVCTHHVNQRSSPFLILRLLDKGVSVLQIRQQAQGSGPGGHIFHR